MVAPCHSTYLMKKILPILLFAFLFFGCKKELQENNTNFTPVEVDNGIKFYLELKNNAGKFESASIDFTMLGDSAVAIIPQLSNEKSFVLSFEPAKANVKIADVVQKSGVTANNFTNPVTYTYTNSKGESKLFKVIVKNYTGLPIFNLKTSGPIESKDVYVSGSLSVNTNGQFSALPADMALNVKGRGNTTWDMPKKPYRLKFNSKQALLGLTAAKNWVLLANYSDKSLLRNTVAFDLGNQVSADFTPHYRFVELVLNGVYQGSYVLTEHVEVNPGRVDIREMSAGDEGGSQITGGYLLEIDQRLDAEHFFYTNHNLPFILKSPDEITAKQWFYIQSFIGQTEAAIFSDDFADPEVGYAKYINTDSFINWYLVKELMKDNDGLDYSSIFYYKDVNGKLGMGPLWDFDISAGNYEGTQSNDPTGWWIRHSNWFSRLFQDAAFNDKVRARWQELKQRLPVVLAHIDENSSYLSLSAQRNFATWDILNTKVWPNSQIAGSYTGEVEYLKTWLQQRVAWMDANM